MGKNSKAQDAAIRREYQEKRRREEEEKRRRENRLMWQIVIGVVAIILVLSLVAIAISIGGKKNEANEEETLTNNHDAPKMDSLDFSSIDLSNAVNTDTETNYVRLNVTYTDSDGFERTGDIVVRLFPEVAPQTVENFKSLVAKDFYDGLTFHRVYKGFMIQGGDPEGDGSGDSGRTIKGEFTANGFTNNLKHVRGVLSMARGDYSNDSASCQFFIVHEDSSHLDGQYASFGYVVYGMDTVDGIASTKVEKNSGGESSLPVNPVTINYATFVELSQS